MVMKDKKGEHPFGDAGQMILMLLFLTVWIYDSFILHVETTIGGAIAGRSLRLAILVVSVTLATWLFRSGHAAVRDAERPARVLTSGAFRWVRHPLYLSALLVYLGLALATLSRWSLAVAALAFLFLNHIAAFEERVMEEKFAEEYRQYKAKTGRWWPRLSRGR
jgi:protein-S-isoprenylcysteine O-methyltransferase Ste14